MEQENRFLPLGSICIVEGNTKKIMIIARALAVKVGEKTYYFDYGASLYPEGMIGDSLIYFNQENIADVVHEGFRDKENEEMENNIVKWVEQCPFPKGDPLSLINT
ncbi:DUF4176 domain-containing protein [Listeria booriae]|uniref:Transposase n=1 Tax=Listeria booriae TaxID=1552123 RepID=A0A099W7Z0_9LIST|nr:DUF4176 domain-containing protein [Listeria booriae]KGL40528.1 transposase [Listeria booriae]MBC1905460.1 DUF4176 domain-containing protein [Listeria booriae]MBC1914007.1 DUF4176 domain-containing protein [Listeria booriae]STY41945.1 Uncharacterized protein conserved in bacteria [Listeria booriae]